MIHSARRFWEAGLRGSDGKTGALFSYVDLEARVGKDHPLRLIRMLVNCGGERLRGALFAARAAVDCARELLRAMLLQAFYSIRSERQLMERLGSTSAIAPR